MNNTAPSPFPGILGRGGHRDPSAPWLDDCEPGGSEQCWYQPVASGGRIPADNLDHDGAAPALTVFKNDLALSKEWTPVALRPPIAWWSALTEGGPPEYSCPDMLALPGSDKILFYSLLNRYFIGTFKNVSEGGPLFQAVRPFNHSFGLPVAFAGGAEKPARNWGLSGFSIAKTGGVGPNNALNPLSRRLMFGTMPLPESSVLPCRYNRCSHGGTIVTLPRDLMLLTAPDGTPRLGAVFAPELQLLRVNGSHTQLTSLPPGAPLPKGRSMELVVEFPTDARTNKSFGVELIGNVSILYDPVARVVRPEPCVGRGPGNGTAARECLMPLLLHPKEPLRVHVFIDASFVEASVNSQSIVMVSSLSSSSENRLLGPVGAARVDSWVLDAGQVVDK